MKTDRLMWLNAAEVAFCRAEGGLLGWNVGDGGSVADPETFYNQGIQLSFEQWNASGVPIILKMLLRFLINMLILQESIERWIHLVQ